MMAGLPKVRLAKQKGTPWHFVTRARGLAQFDSFRFGKLAVKQNDTGGADGNE